MNVFVRGLLAGILSLILVPAASAVTRPSIPAKAAVVMDASGTILFSKFPRARLAPASTVKLVTAMVVLDRIDPGRTVAISPSAAKVRTIDPKLHAGEELTVRDLLYLALMKSINSAAVALAEAAAGSEQEFVALMNAKAREIGTESTLFANASGLPKGRQYTTARDLAVIMRAAIAYPLIREILGTREQVVATAGGRLLFLENSNQLLWLEENMIGGKTGYTGDARHCFVAAISTGNGVCYTAVLGARSRTSLWKSTDILAGIGANPGPAEIPEPAPRKAGLVRQQPARKATVTAVRGNPVAEIQRLRLGGIFAGNPAAERAN